MKRIGILTSSRADFGIYLPLLKLLKKDDYFQTEIIAFGTHLSFFHGNTIDQINTAGFNVKYKIESLLLTDTPASLATGMGLTAIKFADFWKDHGNEFDLVFCLGDRYEMYAAVMAGVPFQLQFAHLHGGETTLGAIDNIFRHSITLASRYHFVATKQFADKVATIIGKNEHIYNVGALSLDNLSNMKVLSTEEFATKWGIDLSKKTILTTFHPETVALQKNKEYINELIGAINELPSYQILITMPNTDTASSVIRDALITNFKGSKRVFLIENLGSESYFTAMHYCSFLLGNTSSGIIEAASFNKYVINLGNRQEGRLAGENVIHVPVKKADILNAVKFIETGHRKSPIENIYFKSGAADAIVNYIKGI